MSLGPVVRNTMASARAVTAMDTMKPHLTQRVREQFVRQDEHGTLIRGFDGKLSFVAAVADKAYAKPVPYKEPAYVPFQGDNAVLDPAPLAKKAEPAKQDWDPMASPFLVGDRVQKVKGSINELQFGVIEKIDDDGSSHHTLHIKWENNVDGDNGRWQLDKKPAHREYFKIVSRGSTAQPETKHGFKIGDRVELNEASFYRGKKGTVTGFNNAHVLQLELDGVGPWTVHFEKARRLEATPAKQDWDPKTSPLQVGDRVRQISSDHCNYGCEATVLAVDALYIKLQWEENRDADNGIWSQNTHRKCFEIIERPAK